MKGTVRSAWEKASGGSAVPVGLGLKFEASGGSRDVVRSLVTHSRDQLWCQCTADSQNGLEVRTTQLRQAPKVKPIPTS